MTAAGGPGTTMVVDGGGAFLSEDKTLQVNEGGDIIIRNFYLDGWTRAFRLGGPADANLLLENVVLNNGTSKLFCRSCMRVSHRAWAPLNDRSLYVHPSYMTVVFFKLTFAPY